MALNLNYTPNKLVDITTLTEDQWLDWRRKGIGGSDVAVADVYKRQVFTPHCFAN